MTLGNCWSLTRLEQATVVLEYHSAQPMFAHQAVKVGLALG